MTTITDVGPTNTSIYVARMDAMHERLLNDEFWLLNVALS